MNNSAKTRDMARGIYLWACLQDLPMSEAENPNRIERKAWNDWVKQHNQVEIEFVQHEQYNLFDRCNAKDWIDPNLTKQRELMKQGNPLSVIRHVVR